jgi:predicted dehydrogenase
MARTKGKSTRRAANAARARTDARGKPAASNGRRRTSRVRWAVIGQGHFAQTAILPAFAHARENAELVAIFSGDDDKREQLGKKFGVAHALPYEELDDFLATGKVQAAYVAVPNHRHKEMTLRAARAGVHVLCEKPMAVTSRECRDMIAACDDSRVKLMIAYRLHFEKANMGAVEEIRRGKIGDPRYFLSAFSFQVDPDNVRITMPTEKGGGPLHDIGTYCINAARYLFRAEPCEVIALGACRADDPRFKETDEQLSAVLRFPEERLATFTVSFGAHDTSTYTVVGTKGSIRLDPAYSHKGGLQMLERTERGQRQRAFPMADQVAPELVYFSDCVLRNRDPEPSGWEGLHDVRIIEAILDASHTGRKVQLELDERPQRPSRSQAIEKPAAREPAPIHADAPRAG